MACSVPSSRDSLAREPSSPGQSSGTVPQGNGLQGGTKGLHGNGRRFKPPLVEAQSNRAVSVRMTVLSKLLAQRIFQLEIK